MARKKLDADVRAFLKGDKEVKTDTPDSKTQEPEAIVSTEDRVSNSAEQASNDGLLADILGPGQYSEAIVRYTADLPESLHQRLSYAAVKNKTTKIKLLRQILDKVLPDLPA